MLVVTALLISQARNPIHMRRPVIDIRQGKPEVGLTFKVTGGDMKTDHSWAKLEGYKQGTLVKEVLFGDYEHSFREFWGDPQRPPFIVVRAHPRAIVYDLFLPGWKPHPVTYTYLCYVTNEYVIGGRHLYSISMAETKSGRILWERVFQVGVTEARRAKNGVWTTLSDGRKLLLKWKTGETIGRGYAKP
ncbi:MAG: hypothetical protein ABL949_15390 [Fimbriimonadaceae bacterium]